jgi:hypothetical protein
MAFIKKAGSRYQVRQGNNNKLLSSFSSKKDAEEERDKLHRKNKPSGSNKGASARKMFAKDKKK